MRLLLVFALLLLGGAVALILAVQHQSYVIEKFNQVRLILLDGQGPDCLAELEDLGVDFTTLGDQGTKKVSCTKRCKTVKFRTYKYINACGFELPSCH